MIFNAKKFLDENHIFSTDRGPDTQKGWLNIKCPFCSDPEHHGGFNLAGGYYNCWRCKRHSIIDVIRVLLGVSNDEAKTFYHRYKDIEGYYIQDKKVPKASRVLLPDGTIDLNRIGKRYLQGRDFDPFIIARDWDIKQTGNFGDYKFRIIAPIYFDHRLVSFQGRDYTDRQALRYKACQIEREVIHHKNILYGADFVKGKKKIIVGEGITDIWRIGKGRAVGTFGTGYTPSQVLQLLELNMEEYIIWFDPEDEAQEIADQLCSELIGYNKSCRIVDGISKDPGSISSEDMSYYLTELGF